MKQIVIFNFEVLRMYDIIIKNGTIYDGTGNAPFAADIGIMDGKIACIGQNLTDGAQVIDATDRAVTPGFIDSHSHADRTLRGFPEQIEKLEQGITTNVAGQCGESPAPQRKENGCYTMGQFLKEVSQVPTGSNILCFVGHNAIRKTVVGDENRKPTAAELEAMQNLVAEAVDNGAMGISFGLGYTPGCFAETDELVALATVAREHGGMVSAHIRNESDEVVESVAEFIEILERSGAQGVYSHQKSSGHGNWGKVRQTMAMMEDAVSKGVRIYSDVYPYIAFSTSLTATFVPKKYRADGHAAIARRLSDPEIRKEIIQENRSKWGDDLSWVLVIGCSNNPEYEGYTIDELAKMRNQDPHNTALDVIKDNIVMNKGCFFTMCEEDVFFLLSHPRTMVCTDSAAAGNSNMYHPRLRATFPRVLGKYIREEKILPLEEMIRKMTSLPAQVYNIPNKGLLREGYDADICVFDPEKITDRSEFTNCTPGCEGLDLVMVSGVVAAVNGVYTGAQSGQVLFRNTGE